MQIDQYITEVQNMLSKSEYPNFTMAGHSMEIQFNDKKVSLQGRISVSFSTIAGKANVRMAFYNESGEKKDTMTLRDMQPKSTATTIANFISSKELEITESLAHLEEFRNKLNTELKKIGFNRECDSKYMTAFNGKFKVEFKYSSGSSFIMTVKPKRRKPTDFSEKKFSGEIDVNKISDIITLVKKLGA